MQDRAGLPLDQRRRFLTGRICVDFTHTGGDGEAARWEILHTAGDLERWVGLIIGLQVTATDADLESAHRVRNAIGHLARARAAGERWRPADVRIVNAAAEPAPPTPVLRSDGSAVRPTVSLESALSLLARDAIDLFTGDLRDRIRICAADNCGLLLVDASPRGDRRWCSMQVCGNRAKVRAHRNSLRNSRSTPA
jgi:predicted RNA-binding Zn ribbon-like protein